MSEFETELQKFLEEATELQKQETELEVKNRFFMEKFAGFSRQHGLPEKFTLPEVMMLGLKKGKA